MAARRMFSLLIIDSDNFTSMEPEAQALYFHLGMRADDDGFVNNPRNIALLTGCGIEKLDILISNEYILPFKSGIVVIKDWLIHNSIRKDRYNPTQFINEKAELVIRENKSYAFAQPNDNQRLPNGCQSDTKTTTNGYQMVAAGKVSIDKNNIDKVSLEEIQEEKEKEVESETSKSKRFTPPTYEEVEDYCLTNNYTVNAERFVDFYEAKGWLIGKNKMKDWKAAVRTWERKQKEQREEETKKGLSPRERLLARLNNPLDFENIVEEDFRRYNE